MKKMFLAIAMIAFLPAVSFNYEPQKEILGVSFVKEVAASSVSLKEVNVATVTAAVTEEEVKPYFDILANVLAFLNTSFPKAGPIIQGAGEIVFGLSSLFTLLSAFLIGVLQIPVIVARFSGANDLADKIQGISDKVIPWFKYLSIFNVQKKK